MAVERQSGAQPAVSQGTNGTSGTPQNGNGSGLRLNSWKEIASHFDRDIRTVQLWEKREGLPIHRHEHGARASVYAWPAELDAWLSSRARDNHQESTPAVAATPGASVRNPPFILQRWRWYVLEAAILLVAAGAVFSWHEHVQSLQTPPANAMLAVLPFEDLTAHGAQDLLVDGLTDDLITDLGRSGRLQVISRRSVMQFRAQQQPLPQIARTLHASLIVDGTIAHAGDQVRITAQLIDAAHDRNLWTGTYSYKSQSMLSMQDEIAAQIAIDITQKLTGAPPRVSFYSQPIDPRARLAYLTGRYFWSQRNESGMAKAIDFFHQATAIDPGYAPAYTGLADSYNLMSVWGRLPSEEAFPQAKAAAQTALSLDPSSAEAYNSLAFATYRYDWDFAAADRYFRHAIELNPNYSTAHSWYGEFLGDMRRYDESVAQLRRAKDLDPLSAMVGCDLALGLFYAGRYNEAEAELHRVLSMYPNFGPAHNYLATIYRATGDVADATKEAKIDAQLTADDAGLRQMEIQNAAAQGNLTQARSDARSLLSGKSAAQFGAYQRAKLYFSVGELDEGYAELDKAYQEHSWWLVTLMVDPGFVRVRNQPRFQALEKRVGLRM